MLIYPLSTIQAVANIALTGSSSTSFYKLVKTPVEPGQEHSRYARLQSTFITSVIFGCLFTVATAFVAYLWEKSIPTFRGYMIPSVLGSVAALVFPYHMRNPIWDTGG